MHTELVSFHFLVHFLEINPKCTVPILLPYIYCLYRFITHHFNFGYKINSLEKKKTQIRLEGQPDGVFIILQYTSEKISCNQNNTTNVIVIFQFLGRGKKSPGKTINDRLGATYLNHFTDKVKSSRSNNRSCQKVSSYNLIKYNTGYIYIGLSMS